MSGRVSFPINEPVTVAIADPAGEYDDELRAGMYQTIDGRFFQLPRPAVVALNELDLKPGESVVITRQKKGKVSRLTVERPKEPGAGPQMAPIAAIEPQPVVSFRRPERPAKAVSVPGQGRLFE